MEKERRKKGSSEEQEDFIELVKKTKTPLSAVGSGSAPQKKFPSKQVPLAFDASKASVVDYRNIVAANAKKSAQDAHLLKKKQARSVGGISEFDGHVESLSAAAAEAEFEDDPDVPPLC